MKALVIEDDPQVARVVGLELSHAGWEVHTEATGRAGLARALSDPPDVVLLDLTLPDVDGMAVCRALRQTTDTPVVMLTARGELEDRVEGLDAGADDYLVKPVAVPELLARLRAVMRRGAHRTPGEPERTTYSVGDLHLDRARHAVWRGNRTIHLTPREFNLLAYFMENPGIVLTRDMILEKVWGWGYAGGTNIVDVYVGYLRAKVESPGEPQLLHTVRGVGYVLRWPRETP